MKKSLQGKDILLMWGKFQNFFGQNREKCCVVFKRKKLCSSDFSIVSSIFSKKRLIRQREEEERELQREILRRDEAFRRVQEMEQHRRELLEQRERDLKELAALDAGSLDDDQEIDHQQQNEVINI